MKYLVLLLVLVGCQKEQIQVRELRLDTEQYRCFSRVVDGGVEIYPSQQILDSTMLGLSWCDHNDDNVTDSLDVQMILDSQATFNYDLDFECLDTSFTFSSQHFVNYNCAFFIGQLYVNCSDSVIDINYDGILEPNPNYRIEGLCQKWLSTIHDNKETHSVLLFVYHPKREQLIEVKYKYLKIEL